jgi:hypothetical protein
MILFRERLRDAPPMPDLAQGLADEQLEDLAAFFAAKAQRQHDVLWDIVLRDVLGPVAMLALVVLAYAVVRTRGEHRAAPQAWALVLGAGALLKVISDLVFLSQVGIWRQSGFLTEPPADMIAVGRASDQVTDISGMLENAADVTVAAGLVGLAVLLSRSLRLLARAVAVVLVLTVPAALAGWALAYGVLSLLAGVLLAPALLVGTGRWVGRSAEA